MRIIVLCMLGITVFFYGCAVPEIKDVEIQSATTDVNRGGLIFFTSSRDDMESYSWKLNDEVIEACDQLITCEIQFLFPTSIKENIVTLIVKKEKQDESGNVKEMKTKEVFVEITVNNAAPNTAKEKPLQVSFVDVDSDPQEVAGEIEISKAEDETFINQYLVFWGNEDGEFLESSLLIDKIQSSGAEIYKISIDENTKIPDGTTYIIVFSENEVGMMDEGVATVIEDNIFGETQSLDPSESMTSGDTSMGGITSSSIPLKSADGISFIDTDKNQSQIAGVVTIDVPSNESNITHYALYFGSDENTKLEGEEKIAYLMKTGSDITFEIEENSLLPDGAFYLLVFTKNHVGEMRSSIGVSIIDDISEGISSVASVSASESAEDSSLTEVLAEDTGGRCSGAYTYEKEGFMTVTFTFESDSLACTNVVDYLFGGEESDENLTGTCVYNDSSVIISFDDYFPFEGTFNSGCTSITVDDVVYTKE